MFNIANRSLMLALGAMGAAAVILADRFFLRGKYILLVYAAFVLAEIIVIRGEKMQPYASRFVVGLGAFLLTAFAHYLYVVTTIHVLTAISPFGHLWRLLFVVVVGTGLSLVTARLSAGGGGRPIAS